MNTKFLKQWIAGIVIRRELRANNRSLFNIVSLIASFLSELDDRFNVSLIES
jgi:hypothetical protein